MTTTRKRPNAFMRPKRDRITALEKVRIKLRNLALTGRVIATANFQELEIASLNKDRSR